MRMDRPKDPNRRQHVEKGENYALAVFINEETGARQFRVVPFYNGVERMLNGLDLVAPRPGSRHFLIRKNDLVYVPRPGEDANSIDWKETEVIADRTMRLVKMTQTSEESGRFYFMRANISSAVGLNNGEQEFDTASGSEFEDRDSPRTKISTTCIPITVDRIGRVRPLFK